jgi:F-type H+-transporting ATPase subunit gamma
MPNLKDIRRRIRSVKSTQKITQAMRMVAAAKVKRAEMRVKASRPYANTLFGLFQAVMDKLAEQPELASGSKYLSLVKSRDVKTLGIVIISSDRGLCGAYNSNIIRQALQVERECRDQGITPKFYLVGAKVIQAMRRYSKAEILGELPGISGAPSASDAAAIAQTMVDRFMAADIDAIEVLSTQFRSMISYKVEKQRILPVASVRDLVKMNEAVTHHTGTTLHPELLIEPNADQVLGKLIPMCLSNVIYINLLEAAASELAARMTAMSSASNNAADVIGRLTILYNKARQASITQELLEVVSGADALK